MRCPFCADVEDKVVDSRVAEDGTAIRRRRECLGCTRRYTTFERIEEVPLVVLKRSGGREPFDRVKVLNGLRAATKNRPVTDAQLDALVVAVEEEVRVGGSEIGSDKIGFRVLDQLRQLDHVAYLRFASVYKGFEDAGDFQREAGLLAAAPGDAATGEAATGEAATGEEPPGEATHVGGKGRPGM